MCVCLSVSETEAVRGSAEQKQREESAGIERRIGKWSGLNHDSNREMGKAASNGAATITPACLYLFYAIRIKYICF